MIYTYDRRGRRRTVVQGAMTTTFGYTEAYRVTTEAYSGRVLGGLTVTSTFSSLLQRTGVSRNTPTALSYTYGYDNAGRLSTVSEGTYRAT